MANKITKEIQLLIDTKKSKDELKELNKLLDMAVKEHKTAKDDIARAKAYKDIAEFYKQITAEMKKQKQIEDQQKYKKQLADIGKTVASKSLSSLIVEPMKDFLRGTSELTKAMLDFKTGVATWSAGTSLVMNRSARELQLQYGLSGSQAYAFKTAGSMLGIDVTNMEDLAFMNEAQRSKLSELMTKYSTWYDRMESSGLLQNIQETQLSLKELKQQMSMDFLEWMGQNKELIVNLMKATLDVLSFIGNLISGLGGSGRDISVSEALNRQNATNITINSTYNATSNGTGEVVQSAFVDGLKTALLGVV